MPQVQSPILPRLFPTARSRNQPIPPIEELARESSAGASEPAAIIWSRRELLWLVVILVAGLLPRLAFAHWFPALPISDFRSLLNFATAFQSDWLARQAAQWRLLSPGLPFFLSLLLRVVPRSPESVGRLATVLLTGLMPLLPYLLWRGVFGLRTRVLAGLMLALWPGQILFSTVVAQDNWVIFPTVALVALAVRMTSRLEDGRPLVAAVLYVIATAIREEMLLIMLPVAILVAVGTQPGRRVRRALVGGSVAALLLAALIVQRGAATGRYTLFTEHLGASVLGAYVPGAGLVWVSPTPFIEASRPRLLESNLSDKELNRVELGLALQELARRPLYHVSRIVGTTLLSFFELDKAVTSWSLVQPGVMPVELRKSALAFRTEILPLLAVYPLLLQALFASSIYFAAFDWSLLKQISPILITIGLKIGLHLLVVSQARYFLVVAGLEILAIAVVSETCFEVASRRKLIRSLVLGGLTVFVLLGITVSARNYVFQNMELPHEGVLPRMQVTRSLVANRSVLDMPVVPCENSKTEC